MKVWQCTVCKYIHKGEKPPERCPICNVPASKFKEITKTPLGKKTLEQSDEKTTEESFSEKIFFLLIKHHAHPVSVHTPNGILPAAVVLFIAAWIFSYDILAKAAFVNMIFVIIALPFVIFTGVLEWQRKYNSAFTNLFKLKILSAILTSVFCVISFFWYLISPDVLSSPLAWLFMAINIIMVTFAGIAGHIGGKLVFKDK
jgi:rubredoxin/uncharacterized membrane protein